MQCIANWMRTRVKSRLYREKNTHGRELRAIQVLGVELKQSQWRRVLLGHSYPSFPPTAPAAVLHQQSPKWIDRAWDKGFYFPNRSSTRRRTRSTESSTDRSRVRRRTSRINTTPFNNYFSFQWERIPGARSTSADAVPGTLRSIFSPP